MLECEHSFHIEKLVVVTYEAAVQSVQLLSLGSNCIHVCSHYLCYSIDVESYSSMPKSSK